MYLGYSALLCMITIQTDSQVLSIIFFKNINKVHQYERRLASKKSYYLPKARTSYWKFKIRFS